MFIVSNVFANINSLLIQVTTIPKLALIPDQICVQWQGSGLMERDEKVDELLTETLPHLEYATPINSKSACAM